jgi:hypothetical protein
MKSIEVAYGLCSVMAIEPSHSRLYKKKTKASTVPLEINLVYPWSPSQCTRCKQVFMWVSLTYYERSGTNRMA